jgi:hypothetical protein
MSTARRMINFFIYGFLVKLLTTKNIAGYSLKNKSEDPALPQK